MVKTLIWMASSKNTKRKVYSVLTSVEAIDLLEDVLASYSHQRLEKIFTSPDLKILYEFFVEHSKNNFLSNYEGAKLEKHEAGLDEFNKKFDL